MKTASLKMSDKNRVIRDLFGIIGFVAAIWLGALLLNSFIFQTYTVSGASMEDTLHTGDHLFVNKLPVTTARITNKQYVPERGDIIVFKNPLPELRKEEEYIVKRVIGLPGERIVITNGTVKVFNNQRPKGFNPDTAFTTLKTPTEGEVEITVPDGELFVIGDNRIGQHSFDSRNGLSTIPLDLLQGKVTARIFPFNLLRGF